MTCAGLLCLFALLRATWGPSGGSHQPVCPWDRAKRRRQLPLYGWRITGPDAARSSPDGCLQSFSALFKRGCVSALAIPTVFSAESDFVWNRRDGRPLMIQRPLELLRRRLSCIAVAGTLLRQPDDGSWNWLNLPGTRVVYAANRIGRIVRGWRGRRGSFSFEPCSRPSSRQKPIRFSR